MSLTCHLITITYLSCIFLKTFLERQSPQDYHMLNEDGELWLVYEGLKQANRLPDFSECFFSSFVSSFLANCAPCYGFALATVFLLL